MVSKTHHVSCAIALRRIHIRIRNLIIGILTVDNLTYLIDDEEYVYGSRVPKLCDEHVCTVYLCLRISAEERKCTRTSISFDLVFSSGFFFSLIHFQLVHFLVRFIYSSFPHLYVKWETFSLFNLLFPKSAIKCFQSILFVGGKIHTYSEQAVFVAN